ncbi:hypothetical protein BKA67DRAFT_562018 [Truncatella angustata]|uniref:Uncharacterized protein n=1 Tax=Truncatella angustata TaxID=152316 RepID=A0A9P8UP93_9PEZI|nr:uncharacterized protein BKA67DRAFT_562018 [Truncatella angustata]KAH6655848.1 hypothetical protein BKA67DRAFT_562018 [Truncatella angustata]
MHLRNIIQVATTGFFFFFPQTVCILCRLCCFEIQYLTCVCVSSRSLGTPWPCRRGRLHCDRHVPQQSRRQLMTSPISAATAAYCSAGTQDWGNGELPRGYKRFGVALTAAASPTMMRAGRDSDTLWTASGAWHSWVPNSRYRTESVIMRPATWLSVYPSKRLVGC